MPDGPARIEGGPLDGREMPGPLRIGRAHARETTDGIEVCQVWSQHTHEPGAGWHTFDILCPTVGGPLVAVWLGQYPLT